MTRLGIIGGAGLLGATTAFCAASRGLVDEIVLSDIRDNIALSHVMDIEQAVCETSAAKLSISGIEDLGTCDIVLITAGIPEKSALSRDDYLDGNIVIIRELAEKIRRWGTQPVILSATNPVDVLNYELFLRSELPRDIFIGFSRNDTLRFKWAISKETDIPVSQLDALVIGEHGDGQVPLFEYIRIRDSGSMLRLSDRQKESIQHRVKSWFSDYQKLDSGRSSGWTSGVSICRIIELILQDSDEICSCSVIPRGEYGLTGLSIGLPVRLGRTGVKDIVEMGLSEDSMMQLTNAANKLRAYAG